MTTGAVVTRPLTGYTVGVTADRRAGDLIAALVRRGAEVLHAPTLRIAPVEEDDQLLAVTKAVIDNGPDLVLATTSHGFSGWLEAADAAGLGQELHTVLERSQIWVRGPKSRGAVRAAGLRDAGGGADETTASLVDAALRQGVGGRTVVVQLHGYIDHDQLARLRQAGARLLTVAPYRWSEPFDRRPVERLIDAVIGRQLDAVTFTSAPAAEALLQAADRIDRGPDLLAALGSDIATVAVGDVTATPLRKAGLQPAVPERFRLGALVRTVCVELSRRELAADTSVGRLQLRGRLVVIGDRSLMLTPSGAAILAALIRADGSLVDKERLRDLLPGGGDDHALEVAVARLRRSLDLPGSVVTVVRRGYRLG
jgi:uroporphyrinogen-III synthase